MKVSKVNHFTVRVVGFNELSCRFGSIPKLIRSVKSQLGLVIEFKDNNFTTITVGLNEHDTLQLKQELDKIVRQFRRRKKK